MFHERVPDSFIDKVFAVMALAQQHEFQVLTKRPSRMKTYMRTRVFEDVNGSFPVHRVGKKAAGRTLDGRMWDEMPAVER